jgi:DNA-binding response OmpR family regulator
MANHRVLIVSTNPAAGNGLLDRLLLSGCQVVAARSCDEAVQTADALQPEVVLVDDLCDDIDPLEISWQIRAQVDPSRCPIFVVSWCGGRTDSADNGKCCADDVAETHFEELVTRVTSYLTQPAAKAADVVCVHGLEIDRGRHRVVAAGRALQLTPTEFRLLWELAQSPGYVFSRKVLTRSVLASSASSGVRTIDVHVKSLRRKLGRHARLVETVRGIGYRLAETAHGRDSKPT